jgi:protein involved in polysaccharide export with SLBB domain
VDAKQLGHGWSVRQGTTSLAPAALARLLVLLFSLCGVLGCTTAPRWPTAKECSDYPERCEGLTWQVAQDMSALVREPAPANTGLEDPEKLARLAPQGPYPAYRIGPLDELTLTVWGAREVWAEVTDQTQDPTRITSVQDDGTIVLPLLKGVKVAGLTVREAIAKITKAYRRLDGASFQVTGQVSKFRSKPVLLDGAVNRPGTVFLSTEVRTLGQAVSGSGGGLSAAADPWKGILIREDKRYRIDYRDAQQGKNDLQNIALEAGDRIFFPSRIENTDSVFYVFGEVTSQGAYPIPPKGMTLLEAVGAAKGPQQFWADMESIFLVRSAESQPKIYQLTLADMMTQPDVAIRPGDRFFVSSTALADWYRTLTQFMPVFLPPLYAFGINEAFF